MYLHELAADENGRSFAAVVNRKLGLGVHGRGWHEQRGDLHAIAPQASERKSLTFTVIEGEAAIDGLIARRDALLG